MTLIVNVGDVSSREFGPYHNAASVTKSDSTEVKFRALYIGGAGDVAVKMFGDSGAVTFKAVPVGTILPVAVKRVMSTNTDATLIIGLS